MRKVLYISVLIFMLFSSCENYYEPPMDTVSGQLVVDAILTNDITKNMVHLSRTRSFYDRQPVLEVSGAAVSLIEMGGKSFKGTESATGHYNFNTVPESGKQYFLRIIINNTTYESRAVTMPPVPTASDIYTTHVVNKVSLPDGNGIPTIYDRPEREVDIDFPMANESSYYRLNVRTLLQWTWDFIPSKPGLFPTAYGWTSYENRERFHLVGPKDINQPGKVVKHPLTTLSYFPMDYFHSDTLVSRGFILFLEQFGISKESYEFHQKLNEQFAASGSLFDPIQTQLSSNILCKSNPNEIVYGYFDLNSFSQHRCFVLLNLPPGVMTVRQVYRFPVIPDSGVIYAVWPTPNNPHPEPIEPPLWWEQ